MGSYGGSLAREEAKVLAETHVDASVQIEQV